MNYVLLTDGSLSGYLYKQGIYRNELTVMWSTIQYSTLAFVIFNAWKYCSFIYHIFSANETMNLVITHFSFGGIEW